MWCCTFRLEVAIKSGPSVLRRLIPRSHRRRIETASRRKKTHTLLRAGHGFYFSISWLASRHDDGSFCHVCVPKQNHMHLVYNYTSSRCPILMKLRDETLFTKLRQFHAASAYSGAAELNEEIPFASPSCPVQIHAIISCCLTVRLDALRARCRPCNKLPKTRPARARACWHYPHCFWENYQEANRGACSASSQLVPRFS